MGAGRQTTEVGREGRQGGSKGAERHAVCLFTYVRRSHVAEQLQQCRGAFRLVLLFDRGMSVCMMQDF